MQLPQLHACGRRVTPQATLPGNLYTGYFGPSDALVLPTEDGIARPLHGACHLGFHNCLPLLFVCVCFVLIFFSQQRTTSGDTQLSLATPKICPKSCSLSIQHSEPPAQFLTDFLFKVTTNWNPHRVTGHAGAASSGSRLKLSIKRETRQKQSGRVTAQAENGEGTQMEAKPVREGRGGREELLCCPEET